MDRAWVDGISWRPTELSSPYTGWASGHGLTGDAALPDATPVGDGVANLVKYALGMDPLSPAVPTDGMTSGMPALRRNLEGGIVFTFVREASAEVDIEILSSNDLSLWTPILSGIVETPLDGKIRIEVAAPDVGKAFYRLHMSLVD